MDIGIRHFKCECGRQCVPPSVLSAGAVGQDERVFETEKIFKTDGEVISLTNADSLNKIVADAVAEENAQNCLVVDESTETEIKKRLVITRVVAVAKVNGADLELSCPSCGHVLFKRTLRGCGPSSARGSGCEL